MGKLYLVFSPEGETAPKKVHQSHKSAFRECHRLAAEHPGHKFFVMVSASEGIVVAPDQAPAPAVEEAVNG